MVSLATHAVAMVTTSAGLILQQNVAERLLGQKHNRGAAAVGLSVYNHTAKQTPAVFNKEVNR